MIAITLRKFGRGVFVLHLGALLAITQVRLTVEPSPAKAGHGVRDEAQPVREPVLGYIFNQELRRLQPILGIPGSAHTGVALEPSAAASEVAVSPRHDFALAVAAPSADLVLLDLRDKNLPVRSIPKAMPGVDMIFISPSGTSAVLYSRRARAVQVLAGLPDAPSITDSKIDLSNPRESITAMAVSDDAAVMLVAVTGGEVGSLFAFVSQAGERLIYPLNHISSISFLEGSRDALVAAYEDNQVLLIRDVTAAATVEVVADESSGVSRPVAVAASRDGRRAFAANAGSGTVLTVPLASGLPAIIPCHCRPSRLQRLADDDAFVLTEPSDVPLLLLDGSSAGSRVLMVLPDGSAAPTSKSRIAVPGGSPQ